MSPKSKRTGNKLNGHGNNRKSIQNKLNDITERTRQIVLEKFTDEQLAEFRDLFNMFDKDNHGWTDEPNQEIDSIVDDVLLLFFLEALTLQSLVSVMKTVGQTPTESDMIDLMREIDLDNSGTIDFYEFVNVISCNMRPGETMEEIRQAFDLFDQNQDGMITFDELKHAIEKYIRQPINDIELHRMIELVDSHGHGYVSFKDFIHAAACQNKTKHKRTSV